MSHLLRGRELTVWQNWNTATAALHLPAKGEATTWIYIGANSSRWDLEGRYKGRQGARLAPELGGAYHLPFTQLFTEGAYQIGATYERSNIEKRVINLGVILGNTRHSSHAYRMIEANWWDAWPHDKPGWLGCHTRFGGWRWALVQLAEPVKGAVKIDPTAMGNNTMRWDMQIVAAKPWYGKRMLYTTWEAHAATVAELGYDEETIAIANRGHLPEWPLALFSPGRVHIQDGMTDRMVRMPTTTSEDGNVLLDTDPAMRTLTAEKDPIDNAFYNLVRSSRILDFFLHDIAALGVPVWRRAQGIRFTSQIPPRTVANIKVRHNTPGGTVTVMMPQRYIRPS